MSKSELSNPIPVRMPVDVLADIERIAETSERSRSWVVVRALRLYLAGEGRDILAVREGREQAAAGDIHDAVDVLREVEAIVRGDAA